MLSAPLFALPAFANPLGSTVTSGVASVTTSANQTQINQKSEGVVIDWSSFNIGAGQATTFVQPNAQAIAVNRIGGAAPAQIFGTLDANGRVVLIDGNGLMFGKGSQVNVGALVATSTGGTDSNALAGKFTQAGSPNASIVNQGRITTGRGGYVALVAPNVSNSGTVNAKLGTVTLGGASAFTIDLAGDGLVSFAAQGAGPAKVSDTGHLSGANVSLTARAAEGLATGVVNVSGTITAQGARNVGGTIVLDAGDSGDVIVSNAKLNASGALGGGAIQIGGWNENSVTVDKASVLNASATRAGNGGNISVIASGMSFQGVAFAQGGSLSGHGGTIETSGHVIDVSGAQVNTLAANGAMGMWTLDPENVTISNSATSNGSISSGVFTPSGDNSVLNATSLEDALSSTSVTVTTGSTGSQNGDITVMAPIAWSANTLTLNAYHSIFIDAPMTASDTAGLSLITNDGGTGGDYFFNGGNVTFVNTSEALSINGQTYTLVTSMSGLQAINANNTLLQGHYALADSLDATSTTSWIPIGTHGNGNIANSGKGFSGSFEGLGNTISNLTVNLPSVNYVGLFGYTSSGTIRDLGIVGGSITGSQYTGALAGFASGGTIENDYSSSIVSGGSSGQYIGGLIGESSATQVNDYATGAVSGYAAVGGLVGEDDGATSDSYATGSVSGFSYIGGLAGSNSNTISNSYASGAVTATSNYQDNAGGLIGYSYGTLTNVYATGAVSGYSRVGGLVGYEINSTITDAYSAGAVTGGGIVGGLVGLNSNGTITDAYWNKQTSGQNSSEGGTGLTSAQMATASSFGGFTFGTTGGAAGWVIVDADGTLNNVGSAAGATSPILLTEYSTSIVNAHQLQLIALNLSANYTLANDIDARATGTGTDVWGSGGFAALGGNNSDNFFSGDLNGEGHVINGLTVDNTSQSEAGLFGEFGGTVENLGLTNVDIVTSKGVAADGNEPGLGALAGMSYGTITNVYATGTVTATQADDNNTSAGGLVGFFDFGTISNSYTDVNVTAGAGSGVGGMAAYDFVGGVIENSYSAGTVTGGDNSIVGGLVGFIYEAGTISDSFASGNAIGGNSATVGGLIGHAFAGTISNSFATGDVSGTGNGEYGGFVGSNNGTITQSYATGTVSKSGSLTGGDFGGFAGGQDENGTMAQVYSTGAVTVDDTSTAGGFIGSNGGAINEVYSKGIVTGGQATHVGAFAGMNSDAGVIGNTTESYYETTGNTGLPGVGTNTGGTVTIGGIADMTNPANFTACTDFGGHGSGETWVTVGSAGVIDGTSGTTPMLLSEYSTTIFSAHQLQLMELEPSATYTVNNDINASGTAGGDVWGSAGFIPVGGNSADVFTGNFSGENYTISALTINAPSLSEAGLFGISFGDITNVALTGANITGGSYEAGALAAENDGTVSGSSASGTVSSGGTFVGGLVGFNVSGGTMSSDSANVAVTLTGFGNAGGLAGENSGAISGSDASGAVTTTYVNAGQGENIGGLVGQNDSGTIATSWSSGAVTGTNIVAGGLVGDNVYAGASISDSYSLGSVVAGANSYAGGLVGFNETAGTITRSWSAGYVSGAAGSSVGGFVGEDLSTNGITNSYFDTESSGAGASAGAGDVANDSGITGETSAQLMGTLPSGFSSTLWGTGSGLFSYLLWQYPTGTPQAISGLAKSGSSAVVGLNVNGISVDGTSATPDISMSTGANGFYYLLFTPGTIGTGSDVLIYAAGSGAMLSENASGTLTGVNLYANTLALPTSDAAYSDVVDSLDAAIGGNSSVQNFVNGLPNVILAVTASSFGIDQSIDATNLVLSTTGTITQTASINATNLDLLGGGFVLTDASNSVGTLAANAQTVNLSDDGNLLVGSVGGTSGVTTSGALTLSSTGTISQSAAIDAASLTGSSAGGATLNGANLIGALGAFTNTGAGGFALTDGETLTVNGTVKAGTGNLALTTTGAGSNLAITKAITADGTATLTSSGAITQSGSGAIDAATLAGSSGGATALNGANQIANLGAFTDTAGSFSLTDDEALTIEGILNAGTHVVTLTDTGKISESTGTIDATSFMGSSAGGATLNGSNQIANLDAFTNTGAGGFALTDSESIAVGGAVNAGTANLSLTTTGAGHNIAITKTMSAGGTATLTSAGTITQSGSGAIDAATLTGSSSGSTTLSGANLVGTLNAFAISGAGSFSLTDGETVNVKGVVSANAGNLTLTTTGASSNISLKSEIEASGVVSLVSADSISQSGSGIISAAALDGSAATTTALTLGNQIGNLGTFTNTGANFSLTDDENLKITGTLNTGTKSVTLVDTGSIDEGASGLIEAAVVQGSSSGGGTFNGANLIGSLSAFTNTGAGGFSLIDDQALVVNGTVNAGSGSLTLKTTGTSSNISLKNEIEAGGIVDLVSAGSIGQSGSGIIQAGTLDGSAATTTTLTLGNQIGDLGNYTSTSGNFALTDDTGLTIIGTLNTGTRSATLVDTGTIGESGVGLINAAVLQGSSSGGTTLNGANKITNLDAFTNTGAGGFALTNARALTVVGSVVGGTGNTDITVSSGNLTLTGDISGGNVTLITDTGKVNQTAGTIAATDVLTVDAYNGIVLDDENTYTTESLHTTHGTITGH